MQAGRLRHRVIIESVSQVQDSLGDTTDTWSTVDTVSASITPTTGNERSENNQVVAQTTHKIVIRAYSALTPKHRFKFDTRIFGILRVLDFDERGVMMICMCKEDL